MRLKERSQTSTAASSASSQGPMAFSTVAAAAPRPGTTPRQASKAAPRRSTSTQQSAAATPRQETTPRKMATAASWRHLRLQRPAVRFEALGMSVQRKPQQAPHEDEFVYVVHNRQDSMRTEPNAPQPNSVNSEPTFDAPEYERHEQEADESRVALLDTTCTACIHSRRWRQSYERSLPHPLRCEITPQRKHFHFANGQSTESKLAVWRLPIFLGGALARYSLRRSTTAPLHYSCLCRQWSLWTWCFGYASGRWM